MSAPNDPPPPYFGLNNPPGVRPADAPAAAPTVVICFRIYAGLMALCYFGLFGVGIYLTIVPLHASSGSHPPDAFIGIFYAILGLVFATPFAAGAALRPARWVWTYNLILICFGMLSGCCWPIVVPMLIYWLNNETKAYYGA